MVMPKNLKHGLDDCKWTKETGLERGSYTLVRVHFIPSPTLHFSLKSNLSLSVEEQIHYI